MGIKGLSQFLDNKGISTARWDVNRLRNNRIAIDANNLCCNRMNGVVRQVIDNWPLSLSIPTSQDYTQPLILAVVKYLLRIMNYQCTPIMVFDGKAPSEKANAQSSRRDRLALKRDELHKIKSIMMEHYNKNEVPPEDLIAQYRKLQTSYILPSKECYNELVIALQHLGIPAIRAIGEGDPLCASLVRDGYCVAALSSDRDLLVYGCPILIASFNISSDGYLDKVYYLEHILEGLRYSFDEFVTWCIMCGCDYNTNIRGKAAGRAYEYIKSGGDPKEIEGSEVLNFDECRFLFQYRPSNELIDADQVDLNISNTYDEEDSYIHKYNLETEVAAVSSARMLQDRINIYEYYDPSNPQRLKGPISSHADTPQE